MFRQRLYRFVIGQLVILSVLLGSLSQTSLAAAAGTATGTVDSEIGLNLRAGPGLGYRVLLVLKNGQALELMGRSTDSQWLEARLPDSGLGGWVYAAYVETSADLTTLPVTEAAGGELPGGSDDRPPAARDYSLYVVILDNVATVYLQKFPESADVNVKLGRAGTAGELLVASGRTNSDGTGRLTFAMPAKWADGKPVAERSLVVAVGTADGNFSQRVSIVYIK